MNEQEQQYIKGFNSGYTLARYEPNLITTITKNLHSTNDFLDGFFSGKEEFELETIRLQSEELKRLRSRSQDRETDLGREI